MRGSLGIHKWTHIYFAAYFLSYFTYISITAHPKGWDTGKMQDQTCGGLQASHPSHPVWSAAVPTWLSLLGSSALWLWAGLDWAGWEQVLWLEVWMGGLARLECLCSRTCSDDWGEPCAWSFMLLPVKSNAWSYAETFQISQNTFWTFFENFGEMRGSTCSLPPSHTHTNTPYNSICSVSPELNSDPLTVPTLMSPLYCHCGQFAMASAPHFLLLLPVLWVFSPVYCCSRVHTVWYINHLAYPASRAELQLRAVDSWAIWTHNQQGQACLFSPFKPLCVFTRSSFLSWTHVSWLLAGAVHPFFQLLRVALHFLCWVFSCWPRFAGPSFEFSGSFTWCSWVFREVILSFPWEAFGDLDLEKSHLFTNRRDWAWGPSKSGSSPAGGVPSPWHCLLSVALGL